MADDPMGPLVEALRADGMETTVSTRGGGFGDSARVYTGDSIEVALISDRGTWRIDLRRRPGGEWFDAELWQAALAGRPAPPEPLPLGAAQAFVRERIA